MLSASDSSCPGIITFVSESLSDPVGWIHFVGALTALFVGLAVFVFPKGTSRHRWLGLGYVVLMLSLNVSALSLHREDFFGPFHVLAVLSLTTVCIGIGLMALTRRPPPVVAVHAYLMAWSYAGLVAAGIGQLATQIDVGGGFAVWLVILATLLAGGFLIHTRIPRTLNSLFSGTPIATNG